MRALILMLAYSEISTGALGQWHSCVWPACWPYIGGEGGVPTPAESGKLLAFLVLKLVFLHVPPSPC